MPGVKGTVGVCDNKVQEDLLVMSHRKEVMQGTGDQVPVGDIKTSRAL